MPRVLQRPTDWVCPDAEGDWALTCEPAGDDDGE